MDDKDIIVRQAAKILELEDKLSQTEEKSKFWYEEFLKTKAPSQGKED